MDSKIYKVNMPEIEIRMKKSIVHKAKIASSTDCERVMREIFDPESLEIYESFVVVYLSRANKTIGWIKISQGGISGTVADSRLILKGAIDCLASGIILAHNHPSGNTTASQADIDLTKKLKDGAKLFDMQILDHIILTPEPGRYFSFADEGLI